MKQGEPRYRKPIKIKTAQLTATKLYGKTLPQLLPGTMEERGVLSVKRPARLIKKLNVSSMPFNGIRLARKE